MQYNAIQYNAIQYNTMDVDQRLQSLK